MNTYRPHSRRCLLMAAALLGLWSATSLAQEQPGGDAVGSGPAASGAPAAPAKPGPAPASAAAASHAMHPAATATAKAPATVVIDQQAGGTGTLLDLNVRAFKPPRRGGVEAVVTLEENKDGGRKADVGTFTIFPAKKFQARKPEDERGFRLDATQALSDLGADGAAVKVKVRLAPLQEGGSAHGARLTLGKVQLVPREEPKDEDAK